MDDKGWRKYEERHRKTMRWLIPTVAVMLIVADAMLYVAYLRGDLPQQAVFIPLLALVATALWILVWSVWDTGGD